MRRVNNNKDFNYDYNDNGKGRNHKNKIKRNHSNDYYDNYHNEYREKYDNLNEYYNGYQDSYYDDYADDYGYTDYGYDDYTDLDRYYDNYGYDNYGGGNYPPMHNKKHSGKKVLKIISLVLVVAICAWLLYSVAASFTSGTKFSIFGPGTRDVRNIVVAGVDEGGYRTDLILLCNIDRTNNQMNILQIPRDTKIDNKRNDKKINSAYFSGFDCMAREISQITGITPDGYIMVSFEGFNEIIDAIGGVTVDVPVRMNYTDPAQDLTIDLQPGKQKLDGEHAQMFMRFRKNNDGTGYANGDMDRINTQKLLYDAVIKKVKNPAIVLRVPFILSSFKKYTTTNLEGEFTGVLRDMAACAGDVNFYSLPGSGKYIGGVSYFVADKTKTKAMINESFVQIKK